MCFDQKTSFGFSSVGLVVAWWVYTRMRNTRLAIGVFYFFLMEFLQFLQYFVIADDYNDIDERCKNPWNEVLTMLGYLHICFQPYFCHIMNSSLTRNKTVLMKFEIILRLCFIGGILLFLRFVLAWLDQEGWMKMDNGITMMWNSMDVSFPTGAVTGKSTEWLRGEKLCTFNGRFHLAWSIPLLDPSYYVPSFALHSFLMYAPFFAFSEKKAMIVQGMFLFVTGPLLASLITPNLMEQASIWCFFSIAQICTMLFVIRRAFVKQQNQKKEQ